ncbi:hypothetical protein AB0I39_13150 [Kitasatospora purpeofusca]|uniref:hypothetical protein n=1 Tax=Kitasatospora purpeofusca TaxID=67352 RepID=UPI0033E41EED
MSVATKRWAAPPRQVRRPAASTRVTVTQREHRRGDIGRTAFLAVRLARAHREQGPDSLLVERLHGHGACLLDKVDQDGGRHVEACEVRGPEHANERPRPTEQSEP